MSVLNKKLVFVGDGLVGMTALIKTYKDKQFFTESTPTVFDNYSVETVVDGKKLLLSIYDTSGQEDYDRLRPLSYPQTDVFMVCFAVTSPSSFENVEAKWLPEVQHHVEDAPIVLVGLKTDLREDPEEIKRLASNNLTAVTKKQAKTFARSIKASTYVECSALRGSKVEKVFKEAIRAAMISKPRHSKRRCTLI